MTFHDKKMGFAGFAALVVGATLAFAPMKAEALTVTADHPLIEGGALNSISLGDVFAIEISGGASDVGGSLVWGFSATEKLVAIETNSLNPINGFADPKVEWNSAADGTGTVFASISGSALLNSGVELKTFFGVNETKYLIASWSDVTAKGSNFDLRVSAVPLPAAGLMLLSGLGGLAALRRRKRAA